MTDLEKFLSEQPPEHAVKLREQVAKFVAAHPEEPSVLVLGEGPARQTCFGNPANQIGLVAFGEHPLGDDSCVMVSFNAYTGEAVSLTVGSPPTESHRDHLRQWAKDCGVKVPE